MNDERPDNDHDALVEIWVMMSNHLEHHVQYKTWWVMVGLVFLGSFLGPILVRLILK